jgi:hypothetical protein
LKLLIYGHDARRGGQQEFRPRARRRPSPARIALGAINVDTIDRARAPR